MAKRVDAGDTFQKIAQDLLKGMSASEINSRARDAIKWFSDKNNAKYVDTGRPNVGLMTKGRTGASDITPGQMFVYSYDAKNAETLDYWDRFPLILFLDINRHGNFLGLNLHYLPPPARAIILGKLMSVVNSKTLRHDTKLKITYKMVKSMSEYKPLQFAIKSYIPNRIQGKIVRIQPGLEWAHAIFFPSEMFVGASKRSVWDDYKRFMR